MIDYLFLQRKSWIQSTKTNQPTSAECILVTGLHDNAADGSRSTYSFCV